MGVARNRSAALHWYRKAYRNGRGLGSAAANIGTIYRDEQKDARAIHWFERAAKLGDIDANLDLAKLYLKKGRSGQAKRALLAVLDAVPPIGIGDDAQLEARLLLKKFDMDRK